MNKTRKRCSYILILLIVNLFLTLLPAQLGLTENHFIKKTSSTAENRETPLAALSTDEDGTIHDNVSEGS